MPANSASAASREQLLGKIETQIAGMQCHNTAVGPGEQINPPPGHQIFVHENRL